MGLLNDVVAFAGSPLSTRVAIVIAAFLLLSGCVWVAAAEMRALRALDPRSLEGKKNKVWKTCPTLTDKLTGFRRTKANTLFTALNTGGMLIVVGWIVPSILLGLFVTHYYWLSMGDSAFRLVNDRGAGVSAPTTQQVVSYVLSQFAHGAILDVMEVFEVKFSAITHDPRHPVAGAILAYRTFVGAFTGVLGLAIFKLIRIKFVPTSFEEDLEDRQKEACGIKKSTP